MNLELHILSECFIDTLVLKTIVPPTKRYNHKMGCNNVLKSMRKEFANKPSLGIIDNDKKVTNVDKFSLLKIHDDQLSIFKHDDKPHYLVKISKAIEDFIVKNAEKCSIKLSDYNLPTDFDGLKKRTKQSNSVNDDELKRLFVALKQNKNSDFFKLAQWIELFKANPYNFSIK